MGLENLGPPILDPGCRVWGSKLWGSTLGSTFRVSRESCATNFGFRAQTLGVYTLGVYTLVVYTSSGYGF